MKYIILIGDGMSDYPLEALNDRTPLEAAKIPNMTYLAKNGKIGRALSVPKGMMPASDVANLSILGYNPKKYYTGRAPLEAANIGVELASEEVAFRCNLVTAAEEKLSDYSAGHITTKEAEILINFLDEKLGTESIKFYPGQSYRHLMVVKTKHPFDIGEEGKLNITLQDFMKTDCVPPHNIIGKKIAKNLPKGKSAALLVKLMNESKPFLEQHEINKVRIDLKENPGNMIWLWGQGTKPTMPSFKDKFGITGSVISAVNLVKGIGKTIGLEVIEVPGATGYYDTDYKAKAEYALLSLEEKDFVYVHVEAPDEAGHNGDIRAKITAIENFDKLVVGTILKELKGKDDYRIMVLPDHPTPLSVRTHTSEEVPFAIYGSGIEPDQIAVYSERSALASKLIFRSGEDLMEYFIRGEK